MDTSGGTGSVAVFFPDDRTVEEVRFSEGLRHGVQLAPALAQVLARAGVRTGEAELLTVGLGPGSFTGLRVGTAFAKTLAFAAGRPVKGVSSFAAMAAALPPGRSVVCARDARRDAIYLAVYRPGGDNPEPLVPPRLAFLSEVSGLLPPGALVLGDALDRFPDLLLGDGREAADRGTFDATGPAVARLGLGAFLREGPDPVHDLAPVYFRIPEAEERRLAREGEPS
jgi:tRNA threonylcarbamoyladenosine biosynthesis protein TsaB